MSNSIEDLLNGSSGNKEVKDDAKKKKITLMRDKLVLYSKELKYPLALTVSLVILTGLTTQTLLNEESEFSSHNLYGEGKAERINVENSSLQLVRDTQQLNLELSKVNSEIETKKRELDNANATITNLTQGYYFIAYLDSLFDKHSITLDKFDINLENSGINPGEGNILTVNNLVDIEIPRGDYSLLPLDIEFTTTSESLRLLFDEFYTRRIVYDKDLKIINNLDSSVTVKTKIEFTNSTVVAEEAVMPDTEVVVPNGVIEGGENGVTDDWDLGAENEATTSNDPANAPADANIETMYKNTTPSTNVFDGE